MPPFDARVAVDLVDVFAHPTDKKARIKATLAWGDPVRVVEKTATTITVQLDRLETGQGATAIVEDLGFIRKPTKASGLKLADLLQEGPQDPGVLKVDFVDVQQGDAALVETPSGKAMLIDGGDNQLFARYLASRYRNTSEANPKPIDCIVVTHGDADHFSGLTEIHRSETFSGTTSGEERRKRLFIRPARVYHNGLVKRPGKKADGSDRPDDEMFGATVKSGSRLFVTALVDEVSEVDAAEMNKPFRDWRTALRAWKERGPISERRLARPIDGQPPADAFDFLAEDNVEIEILGPLEHTIQGKAALPFLGVPIPKVERQPGSPQVLFKGKSASHTINGHSIVLRLKYGQCRILFAGDLNEESESFLTAAHQDGTLDLTAEVFKVPHHGSADFAVPFLRAVSPAVSVISSGDESEQVEHIHPRATLVGGLSKQGRASLDEPLILVTELAAFFKVEGWVVSDAAAVKHKTQKSKRKGEWFAFSRKSFGIVKVRTDGNRMLIFTYSGKDDMKEAYAFTIEGDTVTPDHVRKG